MKAISIVGVLCALLAAPCIFCQDTDQPPHEQLGPVPPEASLRGGQLRASRDNYVGDEACGACHRAKVDDFRHSAHHFTSSLPDKDRILGNFTAGSNVVVTSNPELTFRMEKKEDGFFQTAVQGIPPYQTARTEKIGVVIGSGGKGQTYLFWKGDELFQMPVSYWAELGWVNSPGYRDGVANFDRPIIPRCLECHATYFESVPPPANRYGKAGFLLGITCEKCHGPGREHLGRESSKNAGSSDSAVLNPSRFSRERQMDLCAWCHAGQGRTLAKSFSFLPGEPLDKYLEFPPPDPSVEFDVHGSQVELLEKSRCFQSSAMTCLTCHDVHAVQHDAWEFSQRCLSCHKPGTATFQRQGHQAVSNCIDCHMPRQETNLIVFDWNGKKVRPQVRSHWIRIYSTTNRSE